MLRVQGLRKRYGQLDVLKEVSFEVTPGETVALVGPSGGGKSTLVRCLVGFEAFEEGEISVAGHVLRGGAAAREHELRAVRRKVAMVFQAFNLFANLDALDNVAIGPERVLGLPRLEARERARGLLAEVGLEGREHHRPSELSGGQQQRVAIARALAMQPDVLLLDEPTSALDADAKVALGALLRSLGAGNRATVIVTHEPEFAETLGARFLELRAGILSSATR
jgi:ABC-type polar amino acid transport system ATPase subunit